MYTPHRLVEGYGLNTEAVRKLAADGARLLVTLDCGITSVEEVRAAASLGLDTVVVDHHTVPVELPAARAILNPHQPRLRLSVEGLAAVGVTFALVMARPLAEAPRARSFRRDSAGAEPEGCPRSRGARDCRGRRAARRREPILVRWDPDDRDEPAPGAARAEARGGDRRGWRDHRRPGRLLGSRPHQRRWPPRRRGARRLLLADDDGTARALADGSIARTLRGRRSSGASWTRQWKTRAGRGGRAGLVLARDGWHAGVVGTWRRASWSGSIVPRGADRAGGRRARERSPIEAFHLYDALAACSGTSRASADIGTRRA